MRQLLILAGLGMVFWANVGWSQSPAREAGYLYLSPVPQASYASAQTRYVLVRFADSSPVELTNLTNGFVKVAGATSGVHPGTTRIASDGRTVIFEMSRSFDTNELVSVDLQPQWASNSSGGASAFSYKCMTTAAMPGSTPAILASPNPAGLLSLSAKTASRSSMNIKDFNRRGRKATVMANGVSIPSDFPQVTISVSNSPSPGYLFLENALDGVPPYTMMLDNNGFPVWYTRGRLFDLKIQRNGIISFGRYDNAGLVTFYGVDQNFNLLHSYSATNGFFTDAHELKVLSDGGYYLIGYRTNTVDLGQYIAGGSIADVTETAVQGFTAQDELVFQWRCWDNYDIRDLVPVGNTDFAHLNGLDIDEDGELLVSARHLNEVTKVDIGSGDMIWRLSGAHSSFSFVDDPFNGTSYQHNISSLGKGHYLIFDNGDTRTQQVSRAVEYGLNLTNKTATMVWQFRDTPDKYTPWTGSAQRLGTGDTIIDFVQPQYPKAIEVDTNGMKTFELSLSPSSESYRAFRFPWKGILPAPYLVIDPQPDSVALLFNKFGDTNIAFFRIYGGTSPHPTNLVDESDVPLKQLYKLSNTLYYFRVTAVSAQGVESPFSNEESVNVNITPAGQNMAGNGNFAQGSNSWFFFVNGTASATWTVTNGVAQFVITNGGTSVSSVQFVQWGETLVEGDRYVMDFDASADQSCYIQAQLVQNGGQFADYSTLPATFVTTNFGHYHYVFTMQSPTDFGVNLVFNLGGAVGTINLANISLFRSPTGDLNLDGRVDLLDLSKFSQEWLRQQTGLSSDLDGNGKVDFNDFQVMGSNWLLGTP